MHISPSIFPPLSEADCYGFLCWGGAYNVNFLLNAYSHGIFPWPQEENCPLWFAPPRRAILEFENLHIARKVAKIARQSNWKIRIDHDFPAVIRACAQPRAADKGTWIFPDMIKGYCALHEAGFAHSFEVYDQSDTLIGGLYGVSIGGYFAGESMFHRQSGASKIALLALCKYLQERGASWLDCQQLTPLFESFGAREIPRRTFMQKLESALQSPALFE